MDGSEITSFNLSKNLLHLSLDKPNENHFAITPQNQSPANVYRSDDCNELLAKELEQLNRDDLTPDSERCNLVSQSSIEIDIGDPNDKASDLEIIDEEVGEVINVVHIILLVDLFKIVVIKRNHSINIICLLGMDYCRCAFRRTIIRR